MAVANLFPTATTNQTDTRAHDLDELLARELREDADDQAGRGVFGWTLIAITAWAVAGVILGLAL